MVSGLAPGRAADTEIVGKSPCGSGETGSSRKATAPDSAMATVSSVVAVGRRMKFSEIFIASRRPGGLRSFRGGVREAAREAIEKQIDDRRRVERQQLAQDESADDGDAQRTPQFRSC